MPCLKNITKLIRRLQKIASFNSNSADNTTPSLRGRTIRHNPHFPSLLERYIPTMNSLGKLTTNSAFVAIDIEPAYQEHGSFEIHLALLPGFDPILITSFVEPTINDFLLNNRIQIHSFKIEDPNEEAEKELLREGSKSTFGHQSPSWLRASANRAFRHEDVKRQLSQAIKKLRGIAQNQKFVLVGSTLQEDFEEIGLELPDAIEYFDHWIDISRLMEQMSSLLPMMAQPQVDIRELFIASRYMSPFTISDQGYYRGKNAVETLAIFKGMRQLEITNGTISALCRFTGMEVQGQVGHFDSRPYKAVFRSLDYVLPLILNLPQNLEQDGLGERCSTRDFEHRAGHHGVSIPEMPHGCISFWTRQDMEQFINLTDGMVVDGYILEVYGEVRLPSPPSFLFGTRKRRRS